MDPQRHGKGTLLFENWQNDICTAFEKNSKTRALLAYPGSPAVSRVRKWDRTDIPAKGAAGGDDVDHAWAGCSKGRRALSTCMAIRAGIPRRKDRRVDGRSRFWAVGHCADRHPAQIRTSPAVHRTPFVVTTSVGRRRRGLTPCSTGGEPRKKPTHRFHAAMKGRGRQATESPTTNELFFKDMVDDTSICRIARNRVRRRHLLRRARTAATGMPTSLQPGRRPRLPENIATGAGANRNFNTWGTKPTARSKLIPARTLRRVSICSMTGHFGAEDTAARSIRSVVRCSRK